MTSQPGYQTITIYVLYNQKMKFGQFAEYNKISVFLKNSCRRK